MPHNNTILIVEDTLSLAAIYESCLKHQGYKTLVSHTGSQALEMLKDHQPSVILLDLKLPDISGMDILRQARENKLQSAIIVITGDTALDTAVEAMQLGADDFVAKPIASDRLLITVANVLEKRRLQRIVHTLQQTDRTHFHGFVGKSPEMQAAYRVLESAAGSRAPIMIMGESGTGKELAARAIHDASDRKNKPFVALNCAAIPRDLIESEIFGHMKGAFTGATTDREGAAKKANGGTLFLDELTEMPIALQSKLLRFVQEGAFSPVGSSEVFQTDIRFVSATNRNPFEAIRQGNLREDLYYRLAVIPVELPALRARGQDIITLAQHFLQKSAEQEQKQFSSLSPEAEQLLLRHRWPGNVRELQNTIRRAVVMHIGTVLEADMLSFGEAGASAPIDPVPAHASVSIRPLHVVERETIEQAISLCNGNITEAARQLEINPATIHRKLKQWETES